MMSFESLGLVPELMQAVTNMKFREPMPIQAQVIPLALEGRDVLGRSQTGTGKTAAFGLPILQRLLPGGHVRCHAIVVEPTRELAAQVHSHLQNLAKHTEAKGILVVGGEDIERQEDALRRGCDWIVATPGRLRDHLLRGYLPLDALQTLVLDEADQLLELGFVTDIRAIASFCPDRRQTMMFSATLPREMENLARKLLTNPVRVEIGETRVADPVEESAWPVAARQKYNLIMELIRERSLRRTLIFCRTRVRADKLQQRFLKEGHSAGILHADRPMTERRSVLEDFRQGRLEILVATDIAARGLDITEVDHVVNFDVPVAPEDYIHRVGRTGRAGRPGEALTLVSKHEVVLLTRIENLLHKSIQEKRLEGFKYETEDSDSARSAPQRTRRPTDPGARRLSKERKPSPFTQSGYAKRGFSADPDADEKPKKIKKKLPHRRRSRG